jgi:hypothetical protein
MSKVQLGPNHKRSASSSVFLIEKLLVEIEDSISRMHDRIMTEFDADESQLKIAELKSTIAAIRERLALFAEKYGLDKQVVVQSRFIRSRKTKIWEILGNTRPERLKGFGEFPSEVKDEFESDLDELINLVDKL